MISAHMNPLMQLVGLRDGQGASPAVMFLHSEDKQRCVCCGYATPNLYLFGLEVGLCGMCYDFAIKMTHGVPSQTIESYLLKAA